MYVKLLNPHTKNAMVFQANDEVYFGPKGAMSMAEQEEWSLHQESIGNDPRRFVLWLSPAMTTDRVELFEVAIPSGRSGKGGETILLTNWDGWLVNETGRSMERVSRAPARE